ncbi:MAG: 2-amino-4-hydroxy-6-hydroxymethyldihydropteridine diphosphokinase [Solirubrobacterales bacterium]|nr:2-amino-4-hydroxy-6-hydroxymethyldihydropteridine diphosphokinase [Solirubrobacterales bacterium]
MSSATTRIAYLGLGSNMGDRRGNMEEGIRLLNERGVPVVKSSSVWETEPVGEILDQPDFLNACVAVETDLEPHDLLDIVKQIELDLGRDPNGPRHGPRPLDIDLLLLGDLVFASERLDIPHREVLSRRFVMAPLLEVAPSLVTPTGEDVQAAFAIPRENQEVRVAGPPLT